MQVRNYAKVIQIHIKQTQKYTLCKLYDQKSVSLLKFLFDNPSLDICISFLLGSFVSFLGT